MTYHDHLTRVRCEVKGSLWQEKFPNPGKGGQCVQGVDLSAFGSHSNQENLDGPGNETPCAC
jgi:hypothetical protein